MNHHEHILYLRTICICYYISVLLFGMLDETLLEFSYQPKERGKRLTQLSGNSLTLMAWEKPLPSVERGKRRCAKIQRGTWPLVSYFSGIFATPREVPEQGFYIDLWP